MSAIELDDDGYADLKLGDCTVTIDLYEVHNRLLELRREFDDKPAPDFHAAAAAYLQALGLPALSHRAACKVIDAVGDRVEALLKKGGGSPTAG